MEQEGSHVSQVQAQLPLQPRQEEEVKQHLEQKQQQETNPYSVTLLNAMWDLMLEQFLRMAKQHKELCIREVLMTMQPAGMNEMSGMSGTSGMNGMSGTTTTAPPVAFVYGRGYGNYRGRGGYGNYRGRRRGYNPRYQWHNRLSPMYVPYPPQNVQNGDPPSPNFTNPPPPGFENELKSN